MELQIFYYTLPDPSKAGVTTKNVGWKVIQDVLKTSSIRNTEGVDIVLNSETVQSLYQIYPGSVANRVEITKEAFDSFDVSTESDKAKSKRERNLAAIQVLKDKYSL